MNDNSIFKVPGRQGQDDSGGLEAYFGLPNEVKFCTRCVMSNQRPSTTVEFKNVDKKTAIVFDEEGVCSACREHEKKWGEIDYDERQDVLLRILDRHRSKDGSYDVIVPGSGGKDSMYVSHVLKHEYGMTPLTVTWAPHMYTDIGRKNFESWVRQFNNVTFNPSGEAHRLLTREAFLNLLHPFQSFIVGQKNIGPKMALHYGIKLVMFGEGEAEAGSHVDDNNLKMDPKFFSVPRDQRKNLILGKRPYGELLEMGLSPSDLGPYCPVALEDIEAAGVEVFYMGHFENWRAQEKFYYAVENFDFEPCPERTEGTFTKFSSLDDKIDGLQYYTAFIKFGIGRATNNAATEIRHRYITREEGVALVQRYDGEFPRKYHQDCLDYIGIDEEKFWETIDRFRSPHLWRKDGNEWKCRHTVE